MPLGPLAIGGAKLLAHYVALNGINYGLNEGASKAINKAYHYTKKKKMKRANKVVTAIGKGFHSKAGRHIRDFTAFAAGGVLASKMAKSAKKQKKAAKAAKATKTSTPTMMSSGGAVPNPSWSADD